MTALSFSILMSRMPLNFLQSSVDPDDFALGIKCFRFCITRFKFFDSQWRFVRACRQNTLRDIGFQGSLEFESILNQGYSAIVPNQHQPVVCLLCQNQLENTSRLVAQLV